MKKIKLLGIVFLVNVIVLSVSYAQGVETHIKVTGLKSAKGKISLSVFKDSKSFEKDQAYKTFLFDKKAAINGVLSADIKLEPGTYGITLFDDENGDGKMEKSMIGIPKEGFGFSNFYLEKLKNLLSILLR